MLSPEDIAARTVELTQREARIAERERVFAEDEARRTQALNEREGDLATRAADLDARARGHVIAEALKASDRLNQIVGPLLRGYVAEMGRLSTIVGRPLHTCIPGETGADIAPVMAPLLPIDTCPKRKGVPYVLLVGGYGTSEDHQRPAGVCIAEWTEDGFTRPCWDLWLDGSLYGLSLGPERVIGWYEVDLSMLETD